MGSLDLIHNHYMSYMYRIAGYFTGKIFRESLALVYY